jgi:hypothetical protein
MDGGLETRRWNSTKSAFADSAEGGVPARDAVQPQHLALST